MPVDPAIGHPQQTELVLRCSKLVTTAAVAVICGGADSLPHSWAAVQVQNMRQQYPQAPPALLSRPADTGILQRSDMADKEVISTVTGSQLGVLSDLLVDAETMTVAALCLRQKTFSRKGIAGSCLDLAAMVQVGDVVLVNQDAPWPQTYAQTFEKLLGSQVYTYNGIPLGKVPAASWHAVCMQVHHSTATLGRLAPLPLHP